MLPIATATDLGGIRVQTDGSLSISPDGTLSWAMRYGTYHPGKVSAFLGSAHVDQWLVMWGGTLGNNANNVATLQKAPASANGLEFPVFAGSNSQSDPVGKVTFAQGMVTGTFSLTTTLLTSGAILTVGIPDPNVLQDESHAAGLCLIIAI